MKKTVLKNLRINFAVFSHFGNRDVQSQVSKGFTLIEILIVIAIIGGLMAFAGQKFSQVTEVLKLKAASQSIASDLRLAQKKAISEKTDIEYTFKDIPSSIKVDGPQIIKFAPSGNPHPGYFGTITLSSGLQTMKIVISPMGRIRIE